MGLKQFLFTAGVIGAVIGAAPAFAASDNTNTNTSSAGKHDTGKGAAVGALAGHEVGSGHAVAGGAAGAAIGHHEKKKAERNGG